MDQSYITQEHNNYAMFQQQVHLMQQAQQEQYTHMMNMNANTMMPVAPAFNAYNLQNLWQEHQTFNYMKQQQQMMNINPSTYSYTGIVGPSQSFVSNFPRQFLDSQLQGIYSGLGISPQARALFGQYVFNPLSNQARHTMSLTSALAITTLSKTPLYMSFEQRQNLANLLATNLTNTGLSIGGGITSLAAGVGGLWASAAMIRRFGFWPLAIATGAGYAADKLLLGNQTVAALTGGAIGGWNKNILPTRWFKHFKEEVAEDEYLSDLLSRESYRFLSPSSARSVYNLGLRREDIHKWSNAIRSWDTKFNMSDAEIQGILTSVINNDLITGVGSDIQEFESKFSEQVKYIKNASKILNKSYQEITEMIAEFKRVGIQPGNFDLQAAELKAYAALIGKNVDYVSSYMLNSVRAFTQGTGISPEVAKSQFLFDSGIMRIAYNNAKDAGDTTTVNLVNNFGGPMEAANVVWQGMRQIFSSDMAIGILSNFYTRKGPGEFEAKDNVIGDMYPQIMEGSVSSSSLPQPILNWRQEEQLDFLQAAQSGQLFLNQPPDITHKELAMLVKLVQNEPGMENLSYQNILTSVFRIDPNVAKLMETELETYEKEGARMAVSQHFLANRIVTAADQEAMRRDLISGNMRRSTAWLDSIATNVVISGVKHNLEDFLQDTMNAKAGLPSINLMEYQLSSYDYEFGEEDIAELERKELLSKQENQEKLYDILVKNPEIMDRKFRVDISDLGVSSKTMFELIDKAYNEGRIGLVEKSIIKGAVNDATNTRGLMNLDNLSSDRLWRLFTDKEGAMVDVSEIEGANEVVSKLVFRGLLENGDKLPTEAAAEVQETVVDVLTDEMRDIIAIKDRAKIASSAGFDMLGALKNFKIDLSKIEKAMGLPKNLINTGVLATAEKNLQQDIDRLLKNADNLSEAEFAKEADAAFDTFATTIADNMPGGEKYVTGYFKAQLLNDASKLKQLAGSDKDMRDDFEKLEEMVRKVEDIEDVTEVFQHRAMLGEKYSLSPEATKEDGDALNDAADVIKKYKEATDKYYDLIEDRIENINSRLAYLESGKDKTVWWYLSGLLPGFNG